MFKCFLGSELALELAEKKLKVKLIDKYIRKKAHFKNTRNVSILN
jgi:hypothetical protein